MKNWLIVPVVALGLVGAGRAEDAPNPDKAPDFKLKDIEGKERSLKEFEGKIVVLEWVNHGCPYVKKFYAPGAMQEHQKKYAEKGVIWLSVCSSAEGKQGFMKPDEWKAFNEKAKCAPTAVLLDPLGEVGKLYGAKTTPNFCIINAKGIRVYDGAIDDKKSVKSEDIQGAKCYVSEVLDAILAGKESPIRRTESYGCSVKYASQP